MLSARILVGDCRARLRELPAGSAQSCVTSPPYWGLRKYSASTEEIGREPRVEDYVAHLVEAMREVRRVLRPDGVLWLNLGDSYAGPAGGFQGKNGQRASRAFTAKIDLAKGGEGLKRKDLVGVPWLVAFALRADGWWLRSETIWAKPNPHPESVVDRPRRSHEKLFLLSKGSRYLFNRGHFAGEGDRDVVWHHDESLDLPVLDLPTQPSKIAHEAKMPTRLAERLVLSSSRAGDRVVDPFNGVATTGLVALRNGRSYDGIDINPINAACSERRLRDDAPLLANVHVDYGAGTSAEGAA